MFMVCYLYIEVFTLLSKDKEIDDAARQRFLHNNSWQRLAEVVHTELN